MKKRTTMKAIVEQDLKPIVLNLFKRIKEEGLDLEIDGISAYNPDALFVGGMVINFSTFAALELIKTEESLEDLKDIIRMAAPMEMKTWGILSSLAGLTRLKAKGLLERMVEEETLLHFKKVLDWRSFVDEKNNYAMDMATNYYAVAFNIARQRELLGWEKEAHSTHLLNHFLEFVTQSTGGAAFMDDSKGGDGRFDRYSFAVPGELADTLLGAGLEVPEKVRTMLDKSAHLVLQLANEEGKGVSYGRSTDVYGDTVVLGICSAAAGLGGIFTKEELEIAYGYSMRVMERVLDFWYDEKMQSINLWNFGRKTDNYRSKNRILAETVGTLLNLMSTYAKWTKLGFGEKEICSDFAKKLECLKAYTYVSFTDKPYARGLAIVRDKGQVWMLPLINGGHFYYDRDQYMPVPFQNGVLKGVPMCNHGQLVPQLWMENGEVYMPLAYTTSIVPEIKKDRMTITCEYSSLCRMGSGIFVSGETKENGAFGVPEKAENIQATVRYTFEAGHICREDCFILASGAKVKEVRLVMLTYSEEPHAKEKEVLFGKGVITRICAEGYEGLCVKEAVDDGFYDTAQGRLSHEAVWSHKITEPMKALNYSWTIDYME